jgi:hypothetical protein
MAKYRITSPDGQAYEIEAPDTASPDEIKAFAIQNFANAEKPVAVRAGGMLREIPRQIGLTARYGLEGAADVAGIVTEPVRMVVNPLLRAAGLPEAGSTRQLATETANAIGLPSPQGPNERTVGDITRLMAGGGTLGGAAKSVAGAVTSPIAQRVASSLAENQGLQAASAVAAGGAGGSVREAGGGPLEQGIAAVAGGLAGAGALGLATKAYGAIANAVGSLLRPRQNITEVNVTLNQILSQNGIDVANVPGMVRAELASEVKKALDTGKPLDPEVVRRIADYGVVGATPTRGTVTLDPVQITQERNLAKAGANSKDENLQELARLQNANNAKFIQNLNDLGANTAMAQDPRAAGNAAIKAIAARDAAAGQTEKTLYAKARDAAGRPIELDREQFIQTAYNALGESNKGAFLPEQIKSLLEEIRTGKAKLLDGTERPVPFNVDVIDNLKTLLSRSSRAASDGNTRAAIAYVRNALEAVQPRAVGRAVGGDQLVEPGAMAAAQGAADESATAALSAFDRARRYARGLRNWRESSPAIESALESPNPDRFVQDFIIAGSAKGQTANVEALMHQLRRDPAAAQAVKESVVGFLKKGAIGTAKDEVGNFSQSGYNTALTQFGDAKLRIFFTPEEVAQLKALGRVSSYEMVQPKGSAVNNSNTASAAFGLLDRIASSALIGRLPFGDAAIKVPAGNWAAQIGGKQALDVMGAVVPPVKSKAVLRLENLLGPGVLLAAPRAYGSNDENRD